MNKINYIDTTISCEFEGVTINLKYCTYENSGRESSLLVSIYNGQKELEFGTARTFILNKFKDSKEYQVIKERFNITQKLL